VYGGRGALGSSLVKYFKTKNCWVGSVGHGPNEDADSNFFISGVSSPTMEEQASYFYSV